MLLCKLDSENINNSRVQNNVSSKLIELKFEDTDLLNDNNSLLAKNLANDSKLIDFSEYAANKSDILSNAFFNKLKRFLIINRCCQTLFKLIH